jgi:hypothetical protein
LNKHVIPACFWRGSRDFEASGLRQAGAEVGIAKRLLIGTIARF